MSIRTFQIAFDTDFLTEYQELNENMYQKAEVNCRFDKGTTSGQGYNPNQVDLISLMCFDKKEKRYINLLDHMSKQELRGLEETVEDYIIKNYL